MYSLFIPLAALVVNLMVQIVSFRRQRGSNFFATIIAGFVAGLAALFAMEAGLFWVLESPDQLAVAIFVNAPTYVALAYCYYNFAQLGQTSIRIRLYSEITLRPDGMGIEEVAREYAEDAMVRARIKRLIESRDIIKEDERFIVGKTRLVLTGKILFAAKRLLLGKTSEFDNGEP